MEAMSEGTRSCSAGPWGKCNPFGVGVCFVGRTQGRPQKQANPGLKDATPLGWKDAHRRFPSDGYTRRSNTAFPRGTPFGVEVQPLVAQIGWPRDCVANEPSMIHQKVYL